MTRRIIEEVDFDGVTMAILLTPFRSNNVEDDLIRILMERCIA